jgi:hypothetical protein
MSERQREIKLKKWKNKALKRQIENKKLKRRLQEVTQTASYVLYESISFGSEKILLILGIPSDKIPVGRSVQR